MIQQILKKLQKREEGFTLVELLIVVAIIAILAAIAIPQFSAYRERGIRAAMVADAKNTATQLEAYFTDYSTYADTNNTSVVGPGSTILLAPAAIGGNSSSKVSASKGNTVAISATASIWTITVYNAAGGTNKTWVVLPSTGSCNFASSAAGANSSAC